MLLKLILDMIHSGSAIRIISSNRQATTHFYEIYGSNSNRSPLYINTSKRNYSANGFFPDHLFKIKNTNYRYNIFRVTERWAFHAQQQ